jgi:hypothetical protein
MAGYPKIFIGVKIEKHFMPSIFFPKPFSFEVIKQMEQKHQK